MKKLILTLLALCTPFAGLAQEPSLVNSNGTQIDTEAERAAFRAALQAQWSGTGFSDRFDDSSRYADGATITHLSTTPRTGAAWRIHVPPGATAPTVVLANRGLTPANGQGLFYLGSAATASSGRLTMAFEFTPVLTDQPSGAADLGLNVSFSNAEMLPAGGGILPDDVIHLNIGADGVQNADFYDAVSSVALTCTTTTYSGSRYPWNARGTRWATDRRQVLIFEIEGDYLRVICPGHGALEFYHPDISTKVSASTNFWWEPSGAVAPGVSQFFRRKLVLHRLTDSLQQVQVERWGMEEASALSGDGQSIVNTRLRLLGDPAVTWASGNTPTTSDNYYLATPRKVRADQGFWQRPWSGYEDFTVPGTKNLITAEISSGAGDSNTNRLSLSDLPLANVGEWNSWDITGSFAANGNTKGVQIYIATAGAALVDTGAISPNGGTWRANIKRVRLTGRSHDFYGEIRVTSGGTTTTYTGRAEHNNGTLAFSLHTRLTGSAAGDVKIQQGVYQFETRN